MDSEQRIKKQLEDFKAAPPEMLSSTILNSQIFWVTTYEYSVNDPVSFIKDLCVRFDLDEAGYPFDKIDDIKIHGSPAVKKNKNVTWDPVDKPKYFKPIGKWVGWSTEQRKIFKKIAGETLIQAGYAENNNW